MSSKSISVRIQPNSGRKGAGQRKHDLRNPSATPDYVDASRSSLNSVLIEPPSVEDVRAEIAANRLAAGQKKLQADARTTIAGIITFGTDAQPIIEKLSKTAQDELFGRLAQRVAAAASRPLLGLVVHRDESAIHAHFTLRGYQLKDGREIAPRFTPSDLKRLQDVVAIEVAHMGIQRGTPKNQRIERGESRAQTVHRTVAELHSDLPKERAAEAEKLKETQEKRQYYEALVIKARGQLKEEGANVERLEKRIETYQTRIDKLAETLKEPGRQGKPLEPMQRVRANVVMRETWLKTDIEQHVMVKDDEATRFEKEAGEREKALIAELAKANALLNKPSVRTVLDIERRQEQEYKAWQAEGMRQLEESMRATKSIKKEISKDWGLGD